jgi:hypothetical protein
MRSIRPGKNSRRLFIALPALLLAALIISRVVNVPFWDEWELMPIFQHLHAGHFYWSDFWLQHNEHRLLFPTLALVGLDYITRWSVLAECLASLAVAAGSFVLLKKIAVKSGTSRNETILLLLLALVWFSPVQIENWLWGWQLEWFMNIFGIMLAAFGISRIKGKQVSPGNLALILCGGILAQYSLGSGTLVWPIVLAVLIYMRVAVKNLAIVGFTGAVTTFLYYFHYSNDGGVSKSLAAHKPVQFSEYVLGYLGRPLSFLHKPALAIGFVLLCSFIGLSVYLFVRQKALFRQSVVWVMLGLYAIGSALITGLARLGFGVNEAYSSRYTTISLLLVVSVIMLGWQSRKVLDKLAHDAYKVLVPLTVLGLFCLLIIEAGWGVHSARTQHASLETARQCTRAQEPDSACLKLIYPNPGIVAPRLQYIKSLHWAGY